MMKKESEVTNLLLGLMFLLFLGLKLTHQIDWSWWWVTAPIWGGIVLMLGLMFLFLAIIGIATFIKGIFKL